MSNNIIPLNQRRDDIYNAATKVKELIYSYSGTMSVAEAIGILEMVKLEVLNDNS